jgi:hypothetical protein
VLGIFDANNALVLSPVTHSPFNLRHFGVRQMGIEHWESLGGSSRASMAMVPPLDRSRR